MDAMNITADMSDTNFIIHTLSNLPEAEEYKVAIESLGRVDTTNLLILEEIQTKLNARFAIINKQK